MKESDWIVYVGFFVLGMAVGVFVGATLAITNGWGGLL